MIRQKNRTQTLVLSAVMTAFVVILQMLGTYTAFFGPFSAAVALIPIIIGAALCGPLCGAWLGLVFGAVVLFTGGANLFFIFNIPGTVITVLGKGLLCGLAAGAVYRLLSFIHRTPAAIAAAVVCPVVNTGIFLLGSAIFFLPSADAIAATLGMHVSGMALFFTMATANFLLEFLMCVLLSPLMVRLIDLKKK